MKKGSFLGRLLRQFVFEPLSAWKTHQLPDEDVILDVIGCRMKVFPPRRNLIGRALYLTGVWEPEVTGAIRALLRPGMVVFDVGGDAGYHSLLFAKAVGATGRVIVFEPIPKAQERIAENLQLNGFGHASILGLALGRARGSFVLESPFTASRINLQKKETGENDIRVEVHRLDDLAESEKLPRADLIKIDVEGAEFEVLSGMADYVARHRPDFLIELHPDFLPQFGAKVQDVTDWLTSRNYRLVAIDAGDISESVPTTFLALAK
ncbi:MAG: FkbM family methyltransferase [Verrucomicrobiota bacterium]